MAPNSAFPDDTTPDSTQHRHRGPLHGLGDRVVNMIIAVAGVISDGFAVIGRLLSPITRPVARWAHKHGEAIRKTSARGAGVIVATAMGVGGLLIPSAAWADNTGHGSTEPTAGGGQGSGWEYQWWAYDTPNNDGDARNIMKQWTAWAADMATRPNYGFVAMDEACNRAFDNAVSTHPGTSRDNYRVVLVGGFVGDSQGGAPGKIFYRGNPGAGRLGQALNSSWPALRDALRAGHPNASEDAFNRYASDVASAGIAAVTEAPNAPQVCIVIDKNNPARSVTPHTQANPAGAISGGRTNVSDHTWFSQSGSNTPGAQIPQGGTMDSDLVYEGGSFLGNNIPAGTGNVHGSTGYNAGATGVDQTFANKVMLPGRYHWNNHYSAGADPASLDGTNDGNEQVHPNAPPVYTHATTNMLDKPSAGTQKASVDRISADILRTTAVKDILDELAAHHVPVNYTLSGTDELCYIPTETERKQLPQALKDLIGKGADPECSKGIETKGHNWSSTNGAPTSVTVSPTDFHPSMTGWTPGQYFYILKINSDQGRGITGAKVVGSDPQVANEQVITPTYGYTQVVSSDKQMSNKQGTIIAGGSQPVYDYLSTTFYNNAHQTNGNYWTPEYNRPPAFKVQLTLNYHPDDTAKAAGLTDRSTTQHLTLAAMGDKQKSGAFTPADLNMPVWASGLYTWSHKIDNNENKDVARMCGASGHEVSCLQNYQDVISSHTAPGQARVSANPSNDNGSGWVPDGYTVWNETGTTEPLASLHQSYDKDNKVVITANGHEGNVSTDLRNGSNVPGGNVPNFAKGTILMDSMESWYAVYPQWQMREFKTQQSFGPDGKAGKIAANVNTRAHDRLTWKPTPVDDKGNPMQEPDGSSINLGALGTIEPVAVKGKITLNYTAAKGVKTTLKDGSQTIDFTIGNAAGKTWDDMPPAPDFSPSGFASATHQVAGWNVWEPGNYKFTVHIDGSPADRPYLQNGVDDDGSSPAEQFTVLIPQVNTPKITTTTKGEGTWQDHLKVDKPDQWTQLPGGDFWDRFVPGDAMGVTYGVRLDHNENILATDKANNPAPGQQAKGLNGQDNPMTDSSVTRPVEGQRPWNWTGQVDSPVFTYGDFRPGTGSTIKDAKDSWTARRSGTYWFETTVNYHKAGLDPSAATVAKEIPADVYGQSSTVTGAYVPMGSMDAWTIDNTDGSKLKLSYACWNSNDRYKDEYFYNYVPTISTKVTGLSQTVVAGAGPKPDGEVKDKISTQNGAVPQSTHYNARLRLNYSTDLPANNRWAAGVVTRVDKKAESTILLQNDSANQTPEGDSFKPSAFGWTTWQPGTYWFSISTEQTDAAQADAIVDQNLGNTDSDEYFLVVPGQGNIKAVKQGKVTGADGTDKGQTFNKVGDKVKWTITVTNDGNVTEKFDIKDGKPGFTGSGVLPPFTCTTDTLAPGASTQCTSEYTITQADMDNPEWDIINSATVSYKGEDGSQGSVQTNGGLVSQTGGKGAKVTVGKTVDKVLDTMVPDPKGNGGTMVPVSRDKAQPIVPNAQGKYAVGAGDTIDYGITVTNAGDHTLTHVSLKDPLIEHQIQDAFQQANGINPDTTIECPAGALGDDATLAVGASFKCTAHYLVTQQDVDRGSIRNVATATADQTSGSAVSHDGTVTVTVDKKPAITDKKTSDHDGKNYAKGDHIVWTTESMNTGNTTLHHVKVNDPEGERGFNGKDPLKPMGCTIVSNNVVRDGNLFENVEEGAYPNGQGTLKPGDKIVCKWGYDVVQDDVDGTADDSHVLGHHGPGEKDYSILFNNSKSHADETDGSGAKDQLIAPTSPDLKVVKTADRSYVQHKGDKINYTITMTNTGNVTLHNVYLQDMMPGVSKVTCANYTLASAPNKYDSDPLAPGQTVTCTTDYTVTQDDIDHGSNYDVKPVGDPADSDPETNPSGHDKETHFDFGNVVDWAHKDHVRNPGVINVVCTSYIGPHGESTNPACTGATTEVGEQPASSAALGISKTARLTEGDTNTDDGAAQALLHSTWKISMAKNGSQLSFDGFASGDANKDDHADTHDGATDDISVLVAGGHVQKLKLKDGKGVLQLDPIAESGKRLTINDDTVGTTLFDGMPRQADGRIVTGKLAGAVRATAGWYIQLGSGGTRLTIVGANPGDAITASVGSAGTPATATADKAGQAVIALDPAANDHQYLTVTDTTVSTQLFHGVPVTDDGTLIDGKLAEGKDLPRHRDESRGEQSVHYDHVGQSVTFTVTTTNRGPVTLRGVHIVDDIDGLNLKDRTVTPAKDDTVSKLESDGTATLSPGAALTATYTHIITQADLDRGKFTDTAHAEGVEPHGGDTIKSPDGTVTIVADQHGDLKMKKSSEYDGIGYQVNQTSKYWFDVTNTGNVTMHDIAISETGFDGTNRLSGTECPATVLAPGQSMRCSAHYTASQADVDRGSITNHAKATGRLPQTGEASSEATDTLHAVPQTSGISVVKSVDTPATGDISKAGQKIHYRFDVTNTGNTTVTNVSVEDPKLDGGKAYTDRENSTAPWPSLAPGQHIVLHGDHTVTEDDITAGHVANTAIGKYTDNQDGTHDTTSNTVDTSTNHVDGLRITKAVDKAKVSKAGEVLHYTFVVTNGSRVKASNLTIDDPELKGATVTLDATDMAPGATVSGHADYTTTQADIDRGTVLTNTATAYADSPRANGRVHDMTAVSNQTRVDIDATTGLRTVKTALTTRTDLTVGDRLDYRIDVTNTGSVSVHNLHLDDDHIATPDLTPSAGTDARTLAPGAKASWTGSYVITEADMKAGSVTNTAKADGTDDTGRNVASAPSSVTNVIRHQAMTFSKAMDKPTTLRHAGDKVKFMLKVRNTGNVPLHGIAIGDPMTDAKHETPTCDRTVTAPTQALAAGDTMTCSVTHTTTAEELAYGKANGNKLTNTATATTAEGLRGTASVDVPVDYTPSKPTGKPAIKVTETISPTSVKGKGSKTTMRFTVTNAGQMKLTQVTLSDPLFGKDDYRFAASPSNPNPVNGSITLEPGETITATAEHLTTQAEVDAGVIKSPVTATGRYTSGTTPKGLAARTVDPMARISSADMQEVAVEPDDPATGDDGTVSDSTDVTGTTGDDKPGTGDTGDKPGTGTDTGDGEGDGQVDDHTGGTAVVTSEASITGTEGVDSVIIVTEGSTRTIKGSTLKRDGQGRITLPDGVKAGDKVTWSYDTSNNGDPTLHSVDGTTADGTAITWTDTTGGTLAPGEHRTGTAVHTLTAADIAKGTLGDQVTYAGLDPKGNKVTAKASVDTVIPKRKAALKATKTVQGLSRGETTPGTTGKEATLANVAALDGNQALTLTSDRMNAKLAADMYRLGGDGKGDLKAARTQVRSDLGTYKALPATDTAFRPDVEQIEHIDASTSDDATWYRDLSAYLTRRMAPVLKNLTGVPDKTTYKPVDAGEITTDKDGKVTLPKGTKAGDVLTYAFNVTNTGDVPIGTLAAKDALAGIGQITWGAPVSTGHDREVGTTTGAAPAGTEGAAPSGLPATLAPGQEVNGTATYTITADDVARGEVTNTVDVTGSGPDGQVGAKASVTAVIPAADVVTGVRLAARKPVTWVLAAIAVMVLGTAGVIAIRRRALRD